MGYELFRRITTRHADLWTVVFIRSSFEHRQQAAMISLKVDENKVFSSLSSRGLVLKLLFGYGAQAEFGAS